MFLIRGPSEAKYGHRDIKEETNLRIFKPPFSNVVLCQPLDTFPSFSCQIAHRNVIVCTLDTNFESKLLDGTHIPGFEKNIFQHLETKLRSFDNMELTLKITQIKVIREYVLD